MAAVPGLLGQLDGAVDQGVASPGWEGVELGLGAAAEFDAVGHRRGQPGMTCWARAKSARP